MVSDNNTVFINCPFDPSYNPIFKAILFAVIECGFQVRTALEREDGSEIRILKLYELIEFSGLGIHDLSRIEYKPGEYPRFNMPLELGLFLGCKRYGSHEHQNKLALILDAHRYDYQKSTSDIAGQDVKVHGGKPEKALQVVAQWLGGIQQKRDIIVPGSIFIVKRYKQFCKDWPAMCKQSGHSPRKFNYLVYLALATRWIAENPLEVS